MNPSRYRPVPPIHLPHRQWPGRTLDRAPRWCSVDLRDGNQALVEPMGPDRKLRLFDTLVATGFKEIEVGFPSASRTDCDFVRLLIEEGRIPDDVTIQVLVQAREDLIAATAESLRGARRAIIHLYNSTSALQRRVVFRQDRDAIRDLALRGTAWVKAAAASIAGCEVRLEYSPESFTGTELDFAAEVCDAVVDAWDPAPGEKVVMNLPATVEMAGPNHYADQIEWMGAHMRRRADMVLSVHPHNDRGCAVAAAELAMLAGAERVEGTLFGNGERTGNVDVVTLALNLYTHGIDPRLELGDVPALVEAFEHCNRLPVHPRHPYAGELVFTAFSGSHQDAIKKGLAALEAEANPLWEVPYLPIDPADVGRQYEPIIRINSQSGKGGVAFVLEQAYGLEVPRELAAEFSRVVQRITDDTGEELSPEGVFDAFQREYLAAGRIELVDFRARHEPGGKAALQFTLASGGRRTDLEGQGNGPIDAFVRALGAWLGLQLSVCDYSEHALDAGQDAEAVAYVRLRAGSGPARFGVGRDRDIVAASLQAVLSGVNRLVPEGLAGFGAGGAA
ncbi:MAG TPA: 2-isopropylmalate synthase [Holophaga sp.]|nr:2-isopropylmalate synthase [Holophaga sp.]